MSEKRAHFVEHLESRTLFSAGAGHLQDLQPVALAAEQTRQGLRAQYFNKLNLSGASQRRIEDQLDFAWGKGSPIDGIDRDTFSARFTGRIRPEFTEPYTFHVKANQGVRLWIDGKLVIDAWQVDGREHASSAVGLEAGEKYDLKLEYYDRRGAANVSLMWSSPSLPKQVVSAEELFRGPKIPAPEPRVGVTATNVKAAEPGSNIGAYTFTRTGDTDRPLTVRYMLVGSADNGDDYQTLDGTITIPAGKSKAKLKLRPIDDNLVEPLERAKLVLLGGDDHRVKKGADRAVITIADDDVVTAPPPRVMIEAGDDSAAEAGSNTATFTVTRLGNRDGDLAVELDIAGSAADGLDYDDLPASVTIPDGTASVTITIRPRNDTAIEGPETVVLSVKPNAAYQLGNDTTASATIADDDVDRSITYANAAASPIKRFEAPALVIDDLVYVFGGWYWDDGAGILRASQRLDVYNPDTNAWTRKADLPTKLTHQGMIVDGRDIYMVGGFVGDDPGAATRQIWKYDVDGNDWDLADFQLPEARGSGGAALIGRRLHFFGGSEADRVTDSGDHWSINLDNPAAGWRTEPDLPNARHHFGVAVLHGQIYVMGGQHEHDGSKAQDATVHRYDPQAGKWTRLGDLPAPISHAEPGTFVMNDRIVIGGGITTDEVNLDTILEYDEVLDEWRNIDDLYQPLKAPVVQYVDGRIFVTGGEGNVGGTTASSRIGTLA